MQHLKKTATEIIVERGESFLLYAEWMTEQEKQVSMARLLERFTALVEFYEYPVFQGYQKAHKGGG